MESLPDLPDENTLVLPDAWRRQLHPRRGGLPVAPPAAPETDDGLTPELRAEVEKALRDPTSDSEVADRGLAHLRGSASPAGAAAVATALAVIREASPERYAERWATDHGLAFAACAVAELSTLVPGRDRRFGYQGVRYARGTDHSYAWWDEVARRVRGALACAPDDEYAEAVERLAHCRRTATQRVVTCYLVPTRQDWVDDCCANPPSVDEWWVFQNGWMLLCALGSAEQARGYGHRLFFGWDTGPAGVLATMLEGVGVGAVPLLTESLDDIAGSGHQRLMLNALALLPFDEAFRALLSRLDQQHVQPATLAAMRRFPVRALRLLAEASSGTSKPAAMAADLLRDHVRARPELTAAVLPELPVQTRTVVESMATDLDRVPEAPVETLPPLLVTPPWTRDRKKTAKPAVVQGLTPPADTRVQWAPGERAAWRDIDGWWRQRTDTDWEPIVEGYQASNPRWYHGAPLFADGPEELARPLLADWEPEWYGAAGWLPPIIARFELEALPVALGAARANPGSNGGVLLPFLNTEVALLAADWLARLRSARGHALAWFGRHGTAAVPHLVPTALGIAGPARRGAANALRLLASRHGAGEVVTAARVYGEDAARAVEPLLTADPLDVLPARVPRIGDWVDPALLPQVLLRDRTAALPGAATKHLITMLAISALDQVYAGLDVVRELCDPVSLAEFGRAVFDRWQAAGAPAKDGWALTQLGLLGDDETVRQLAPTVRAWPGEGGHRKAVIGLDVLAAIGTDVALMHLHGIAQKAKFGGLKSRAQEKIQVVADQLGLTSEQLADRLVPDFGLAADGSMTLDYGPRRFVVGFDEQLKPYVTDGTGSRRASLPKPGAKDDPDLAPAAYRRFAALKKDVRTVAADQIRRLEAAMVTRRRWSLTEFGSSFVAHPLLWHIACRLVWTAEGDGRMTAFRIAEDRTYADVADDALTLPDTASIGLAHPLDLGDDLKVWTEVFADYEIMQPFPQLGRAVYRLTDAEAADHHLARFEGVTVPTGQVIGMERRGWQRGERQDGGVQGWIFRELPGGLRLVVDLSPGIVAGGVSVAEKQTLERVWLAAGSRPHWPEPATGRHLGGLDPVFASEILADLTGLTGLTGLVER